MTSVMGWDIGGANLKAARAKNGVIVGVAQLPCAPHHGLANIESAIRAAVEQLGPAERHGVTMTAELSDAFESRARGVVSIAAIFAHEIKAEDVCFYAGARGFLPRAQVADAAEAVASANWRASAELAARHCAEALFIDMGSTTTDIIPIRSGAVAARGANDAERLAHGELAYAGFSRGNPLAYARLAPVDGRWTPLVNENFATMADVRRLLGELPEGADLAPAADGRAKTAEASRARLARLAGRDAAELSGAQWREFATFLARAQMRLIEDQIALILSRDAVAPGAFSSEADSGSREENAPKQKSEAPVIGAGVGRGLIAELAKTLGFAFRDFDEFLPAAPGLKRAASDCAPAAALALLLGMRA